MKQLPSIPDPTDPEPSEAPAKPVAPSVSDAGHSENVAGLFQKSYARLVQKIFARTGSRALAQDIAAEAFAEVLSQRPGAVNFLGAYLFRAAENIATNWLTHESMRGRRDPIAGYDPIPHAPTESLLSAKEKALVERAVQALPARLRTALLYRVWDDLSYEEIVQRFSAIGVQVSVRTVQRYVAEAITCCRYFVRETEQSTGRRRDEHEQD